MNASSDLSDAIATALGADMPLLVRLARDWHGGQASAAYSLASTGRVQSWEHLWRLWVELDSEDLLGADRSAVEHLADLYSSNPYASGVLPIPGAMAYTLFGVTDDGACLCEGCIRDADNPVHPADPSNVDGWGIAGWDCSANVEDDLYCDHCNRDLT